MRKNIIIDDDLLDDLHDAFISYEFYYSDILDDSHDGFILDKVDNLYNDEDFLNGLWKHYVINFDRYWW